LIRFHHIGILVANISNFESKLFYESKLEQVHDGIQNAHLALYKNFGSSYIELIQPLDETAFTWNFLKKRGVFAYHHLCYEVDDMNELYEIQKKYRLIPILCPVPAVLFKGKMVAFFYSRNKEIVEFLIKSNENTYYI